MFFQRFQTLLLRSLRLRCPLCGRGKLFRRWFHMHECCSQCGIRFEREGGFFLGSIYFNYGLTALIIAVAYPVLLFNRVVSENILLISSAAFAVLFPMLFFPYARALWLGFDQLWDPRQANERQDELPE